MQEKRFNVINLHLTEKCNYKCKYCFAKFNNDYELDFLGWIQIVDKIYDYYQKNNIKNGRINLAGGEPLIVNYLDDLITYISYLGIKVSIITNASMLTKERIEKWINKVDMIGLSIDSVNPETNILIGRSTGLETLNIPNVIEILNYAKSKGIKIKVNTVVSKFNLSENLGSLYDLVGFDRVKILQVRINDNCNERAREYEITNEEYKVYCSKITFNKNFIFEPDSDIECSYVIIDPRGDFITNKNNSQRKIGSVLKESIEHLILKAELKYEVFIKRYENKKGEKYDFENKAFL